MKPETMQRLLRYITVGVGSFGIELSVIAILFYGLHTSHITATLIAFWVGLVASFSMQKLFAFQDFQRQLRAISRQALLYGLLVFVNYGITLLIVSSFPAEWVLVSRSVALLLTTTWNYYLYNKVIFRAH